MKIKASILLFASLLAAQAQNTPPADSSAPAPVVIASTNGDPASGTAPALAPTNETDSTSAPATPPVAEISQISFTEISLTAAIENLARRAKINYMLDPKIGYGLPDANGQIRVEPTLSIRWENISAEKALLALLDNYSLQLIRNRETDIDRITVKDPAAPPPLITRVIQLQYASVSNIIEAAQSTLTDKRSKVITDPRTSQLVVVATDPEQQSLDVLIARLDTPTKQVLIETRLVEISSSPSSKKGIDWAGTLGGQHVTFGNNLLKEQDSFAPGAPITSVLGSNSIPITQQQLSPLGLVGNTASGLGTMGFLNADGLSTVISFLNASSDAQVVSTPRIVTLDNQLANISVTRGYPVFNVSAGTANTAGGSSITYSNVGTILQVTPRISAGDKIWLKVHPEVSSFFGTVSKTVGGQVFQADLFDNRTFDTQVLIPNAHTLVLGGLVKDAPNSTKNKVPLLGDVPVLGYAFRSESKSMDKQNLLIFITPTIVKDTDFHATETKFLEAQPVKTKQYLNPDSAWDGTRAAAKKKPVKDPQILLNEEAVQ
jgi:type II secretory pathway component GspD/PulD (secretin)